MLHPVGNLPPSVYWRRRIALFASLVVLIALTAWVLRSGDSETPARAGGTSPHTSAPTTPSVSIGQPTSSTATTPTTATNTASASTTSGPQRCKASQLQVSAVVGKPSYHVGDQPTVMLQVTNNGPRACVQDLADSQIELRVYNGESRVWGSHDCQIQPGVTDRTLAVDQPVRVSIVWSGLSSQPHCAGTRQRVGAGTYTLYALLSGHDGQAAQFSIS